MWYEVYGKQIAQGLIQWGRQRLSNSHPAKLTKHGPRTIHESTCQEGAGPLLKGVGLFLLLQAERALQNNHLKSTQLASLRQVGTDRICSLPGAWYLVDNK